MRQETYKLLEEGKVELTVNETSTFSLEEIDVLIMRSESIIKQAQQVIDVETKKLQDLMAVKPAADQKKKEEEEAAVAAYQQTPEEIAKAKAASDAEVAKIKGNAK